MTNAGSPSGVPAVEADETPLANVVDRVAESLGPGPHTDFNAFLAAVEYDAEAYGVKLTAKRKKLLQSVLAERDEGARQVMRASPQAWEGGA